MFAFGEIGVGRDDKLNMEPGEGNINLLPDDLKKIEEQLAKPERTQAPASFHLPEGSKSSSVVLPPGPC